MKLISYSVISVKHDLHMGNVYTGITGAGLIVRLNQIFINMHSILS